jgi:hypothetical protein
VKSASAVHPSSTSKRRKPDQSLHLCTSSVRSAPFRLSSRYIIRSLAQTEPTRSRHLRGFWPYREKLSARRLRLLAMMLHVVLRRFRCVMRGMVKVTLSGMRVVRGRLVVALFVMSCRCAMMARRVFVMFRCLVMMLCRLLRHSSSSSCC